MFAFLSSGPSDFGQGFFKGRDSLPGLLAGAKSDANAAIAAGIVGAIADQNTSCAHGCYEFAMLWANTDENEVGLGGPVGDFEALQGRFEQRP
jgi:hypothetical protein